MKNYKIVAAFIASFVLGASAAGVLAQGTARTTKWRKSTSKIKAVMKPAALISHDPSVTRGPRSTVARGYNKSEGKLGASPANRYLIIRYPSKERTLKAVTPVKVR